MKMVYRCTQGIASLIEGAGLQLPFKANEIMTSLINSKFAALAEKQAKEDNLWNCDPRDQGERTF